MDVCLDANKVGFGFTKAASGLLERYQRLHLKRIVSAVKRRNVAALDHSRLFRKDDEISGLRHFRCVWKTAGLRQQYFHRPLFT